ncbi:MAG: universal stress protein [Nitrosopumilus sp.]|nr:universal stress protein [Nitrosopumilus sp.]MCV0393157.1 universal stress protein [Nitrosopumilus sp.]
MYNNILVPHAGTPAGDQALKHAVHAAKGTKAKIILLHVVEEMQHPPTFALSSSEREKLLKNIKDANEDIRKGMIPEFEKREKICQKNNIESVSHVVTGSAYDEILKAIKKYKVDLVVMAKRRKLKGIKGLLSLGSVSRKVVENTTCPILMIDIEKK